MRRRLSIRVGRWLTLLLALALAGCAGARRAAWPGAPDQRLLELTAVRLADADFSRRLDGDPRDVEVRLRDNGREIAAQADRVVHGSRGERALETPLRWLVEFRPDHSYQVVLQEQALLGGGRRWDLPPAPEMGHWVFVENEGRLSFGAGSALVFRTRVLRD